MPLTRYGVASRNEPGRLAVRFLQRQRDGLIQRERAAGGKGGVERRFVKLRAQYVNMTLLLGLVVGIAMTPANVAD